MTNKKVLNIVLAVLILAIWGSITFRIVGGLGDDAAVMLPQTGAPQKQGMDIKKETFRIKRNYPDPFLNSSAGTLVKKKEEEKPKTSRPNIPSRFSRRRRVQKTTPDVKISYSGVISEKDKNNLVGLMQVNDKNYLVHNGDSIPEVKIIRVYRDSVNVIISDEHEKTITVNKSK